MLRGSAIEALRVVDSGRLACGGIAAVSSLSSEPRERGATAVEGNRRCCQRTVGLMGRIHGRVRPGGPKFLFGALHAYAKGVFSGLHLV